MAVQKLSSKNQIVIPKEARQAMGVKGGDPPPHDGSDVKRVRHSVKVSDPVEPSSSYGGTGS